ncbi:beta strand repeat-containing protein, partial [Burkholderia ubonensis]|uniref:beta strand repeat-containing protein n=1 Tax=Burkholderia ubonensis TaxID=101571 RepID=UPI000AFB4AAD
MNQSNHLFVAARPRSRQTLLAVAIASAISFISISAHAQLTGSTDSNNNNSIGTGAGGFPSSSHDNTVIGTSAGQRLSGNYNVVVGPSAGQYLTGDSNVVSGTSAGQHVTGNNNVAIGTSAGSDVSASDTIAIGTSSAARGSAAVAVGANARAIGVSSTAIGNSAVVNPASDTGSLAVGFGATVAPANATSSSGNIAFGMNAVVGGAVAGPLTNAIAIGTGAASERSNGIAIGASSHSAFAGIALGLNANSGADGQIAIGTNAKTDGAAFGGPAGIAIGTNAFAGTGVSIGANATNTNNLGTAVGVSASAGYQGVALGVNATSSGSQSVALGSSSTDGGRNNVVSVGNSSTTRAITNVTAGTTATDAANVGQLPGTINGNGTVVKMGSALAPSNVIMPVTVTNVAAGTLSGSSTDAVNGSQLFATNLAVTGNKQILDNLTARVVNGTIGLVQQQGGAPGSGAITVGTSTGGSTVDFTGTAGARQLKGVAAGVDATDAVNVGQLNAVGTIVGNSVQYDDSTRSRVTLGGTAAGAPVALSNVAAGAVAASSTDAVNGSQLYSTNQAVAGNKTAIDSLSTGIANGTVGLVQQQGGAPGSGAITVGASTGGSAVDFAGTAGARQLKGVAAGVDATDAVNVGQLNAVGTIAGNSVQYDDSTRSRVTLGGTAAGAPVALSNVAAGAVAASSTDAVNGSQLYSTNQAVAGNKTAIDSLSTGIANGTVGLVQQQGGAPGSGTITVGASTGGSAVDFTGTAGARQLKGVAAGVDATDAVNVGQL